MSINEFVLDSVNVPTEIRDVASDVVKQAFKKAGFKKKHLNDPKLKEMAKELIMEDMKKYTMSEEEAKEEIKSTVPSPPPAPSSGTKVPPPPPPAKLNQTENTKITNIKPVMPTAPKTDLSKTSVPPPPPMIKGKAPPPPPPPPKQQNNTFKLVDSKTGQPSEKQKPKEKTLLELIQEQNANLKPVTHKKEEKPLVDKSSLESKLQALLKARKEELQKDESSDDSDVSDDDSDEFD